MTKFQYVRALTILASTGAASAVASGQISAIFSNIAGESSNIVPTSGDAFAIGTTSASAFDRPYLSPDGVRWILGAIAEAGADDKDIVIVGGGTTATGSATVATEDSATAFDGTRTYSAIDQQMGINNAGQYVFNGDLDGATTDDEVIVRFDGVSQAPAVREGTASPIGGQNFGSTMDAAHILADGTVRYRTLLTPTTTKMLLGSSPTSAMGETDVTSPAGQLVGPSQTVDVFATGRFMSSASGAQHIWFGDLNGSTATDDVMVVNGSVVAQQGAQLPGGVYPGVNVSTFTTDTGSQFMSSNGSHWLFRAGMTDLIDVVVKNGAIIAQTDQPIFPSATENWDDTAFAATFFMNTSNNVGDVVVGGLTNIGNAATDAVLVYLPVIGAPFVLVRESDPVDLDGNGLFDDDAFIATMGNDDGVLADDGNFYFVASLKNAAGTATGNAFMHIRVPAPATAPLLLAAAAFASRRRRIG